MDKQQRVFILDDSFVTFTDDWAKINQYLKEGWLVVNLSSNSSNHIIVIEKDFTLK